MDIGTIAIYYFIIAASFSISTFWTYIRPAIKIAKHISEEEENVLGTSLFVFIIQYMVIFIAMFPYQLYIIFNTDPEEYQEAVIEVLLK